MARRANPTPKDTPKYWRMPIVSILPRLQLYYGTLRWKNERQKVGDHSLRTGKCRLPRRAGYSYGTRGAGAGTLAHSGWLASPKNNGSGEQLLPPNSQGNLEPPLARSKASTALTTPTSRTISHRIQKRNEPMARPLLHQKLHGGWSHSACTPWCRRAIGRKREGRGWVISFSATPSQGGPNCSVPPNHWLGRPYFPYFWDCLSDLVVGFSGLWRDRSCQALRLRSRELPLGGFLAGVLRPRAIEVHQSLSLGTSLHAYLSNDIRASRCSKI